MTTLPRSDPPTTGSEAETLIGFLEFLRSTIEFKTADLDAAQLDTRLAPSTMTLGGMLKHLAYVEDWWFSCVLAGLTPSEPFATAPWSDDPDWDWHSAVDDEPEQLRALWQQSVADSRRVTRAALSDDAGLDQLAAGPTHHGPISLRWILVHMIEEYARHAGHADLIRESIDGQVGE